MAVRMKDDWPKKLELQGSLSVDVWRGRVPSGRVPPKLRAVKLSQYATYRSLQAVQLVQWLKESKTLSPTWKSVM